MFAVNGHLHLGVMCLAISGLCDMFDGKIARTKKNRTEVEKRFGDPDRFAERYRLFRSRTGGSLLLCRNAGCDRCGNPDVLCACRSDPPCMVQCNGRTAAGRNLREERMLPGTSNHFDGDRTSDRGCIKTIFRL